ncbi:peptide chain release factor H [Aureisphaera galaxeae]|uniref:peptide chain release factor H n=1 Tax=Aureisphaera galaxeae TaxID=1538023 RepID=UPI00234FDF1E|nr:peptide chain release factor H [Aureisphaera galaxeae]MDC8002928.1 peptide chain release factor H [Aureisphaera galaxeae]
MKKKSQIIQLTAGRGPAECCWVVSQVLKFFVEDLKAHRLSYEVLDRQKGPENSTLQSATVQVEGEIPEGFIESWLGTIQWIGKSEYRKFHKRKNWFIGMFALETTTETALLEKDLKFQAMRSSGPGGQHVSKTNSAVRVMHIPTGVSVQVMDSRSQHQNKKIARERLKAKLNASHRETLKKQIEQQWENHLQLTRGNPIRVFTGSDFKPKKVKKTNKAKRQQDKMELKKGFDQEY